MSASRRRTVRFMIPAVLLLTLSFGHAVAQNLTLLGEWVGGTPEHIEAQGTIAVSTVGRFFHVYGIQDPSTPLLLGSLPVSGCTDMDFHDTIVALIAPDSGIHIIDLSVPSQPQLSATIPGAPTFVRVDGTTVYMLEGPWLKAFDISTPSAPALLDSYEIGWVADIEIVGDTICYPYGNQIFRLDISDPADLRWDGAWSLPIQTDEFQDAEIFWANPKDMEPFLDGLVYGVSLGLRIMVAPGEYWEEILSMRFVLDADGNPRIPEWIDGGGETQFSTCGNHLLIAESDDVLSHQRWNGSTLVWSDGNTDLGALHDIHITENVVLVSRKHREFEILDHDLLALGSVPEAYGSLSDVAVTGDTILMSSWLPGVIALTAATPEDPTFASRSLASNSAYTVAAVGPYAFLGGLDGLDVWDVSNPTAPTFVQEFPDLASVPALAGVGDIVYGAMRNTITWDWNMVAIDTGDAPPFSPSGSAPLPSYPHHIAIDGDRLYVAAYHDVHVYSLADPPTLALLGTYPDVTGTRQVAAQGGLAYLAISGTGLRIVDLGDVAAPMVVSEFACPSNGRIHVADGYAYLGSNDTVTMIDISTPSAPVQVGSAAIPYVIGFEALGQDVVAITTDTVFTLRNDLLGSTTVDELPTRTNVRAYPNPFNPMTTIAFDLHEDGPVDMAIVDAKGRIVAGLIDAVLPAGRRSVRWDGRSDAGRDVPSGVYFARIRTVRGEATAALSLIR